MNVIIRSMSRKGLVLFVFFLVYGCSGGGGGGTTTTPPTPPPPPQQTNTAPIAQKADIFPQDLREGGRALLEATARDPDGDALTYSWVQTAGPTVVIEDPQTLAASFIVPAVAGLENLDFEFRATDPDGLSATADASVFVSSDYTPCGPIVPPSNMGIDPFYQKFCDANGILILASADVPDEALECVWYQTNFMTRFRPLVLKAMVANGARVAIIGKDEVLRDLPEFRGWQGGPSDGSGRSWDELRGLGGVVGQPITLTAEENVLHLPSDDYGTFNTLGHEFAHTMHEMGLRYADPPWESRLIADYNAAMANDLWHTFYNGVEIFTWSRNDEKEYWAEGVGIFLNAHFTQPSDYLIPDTRDELRDYDSNLYDLVLEVFPAEDMPACPTIP